MPRLSSTLASQTDATTGNKTGQAAASSAISLHLGSDLRLRGTALHRYRKSRSGLSRRSRQARRDARAVLQERRSAHPHSGVGREGKSDRRLRRLRPGLPHRSARQGLRAFRGATARDHVHCHRRQRHHLCGVRGRQEPQSAAAAAGAGNRLDHASQWFSRNRCRPPTPALPCRRERRSTRLTEGQAPRKLWSGKDEIVYALAARPDGLLALSGNRGHIFRIQRRRQSTPTLATCKRSRAEPGRRAGQRMRGF